MRPPRATVIATFIAVTACTSTSDPSAAGQLLVTGSNGSVRVLTATGEEVLELDDGAGPLSPQPVGSPDGSTVIWTGATGTMIWSDGELGTVATPFLPFYYAWNPDSQRVAALGNDGDSVGGILIDVARATYEDLVSDRPLFLDWSADGSAIAYHLGSTRLLLVGNGEPVFEDVATGFAAPDMLSDGRIVAVRPAEQGAVTASIARMQTTNNRRLVIVDPESEEIEESVGVQGIASFAASPNETQIALLDGSPHGGVLVGHLSVVDLSNPGESRAVTDDPVVFYDWSPSGDGLLLVIGDATRFVPEVWDGGDVLKQYPGFVPTTTFITEYLPFWDQYQRSLTVWSPDGAAFAYAGIDETGASRVFVQRIDDADPQNVGSGAFVSWVPRPEG